MAIAEVNGQRLYYEVHGEGEPLLCVHGLACDTLAWIPQIQAFSAAHRTVIFDNRDVGQSSMAEGDYEIADMARDALALADELGLDTFHLARHLDGRRDRAGDRDARRPSACAR